MLFQGGRRGVEVFVLLGSLIKASHYRSNYRGFILGASTEFKPPLKQCLPLNKNTTFRNFLGNMGKKCL